MQRILGLLATLAVIGCRDMMQPAGPRTFVPTADVTPAPPPPTNECASPPAGTIWCDDFEVDRLNSYFEQLSASTFARTAGVGFGGSYGMRAVYTPGVSQAGDLKVAFGRSPDPDYVKPVDAGTADYRDIYWRVYLKNQAGWTGGGGGAFTRATVLASACWAQAAVGHVFAADGDALLLDPVRGTDEGGALVTTGYNDVDHFSWLGNAGGATPIFDGAHVGQWYCLEAHMKLNDPGQANGVLEYWINGALDAQRTGLNFVGSYTAFGINTIFFENYWNATAPQPEERYWDNIVVATQRVGCGTTFDGVYQLVDLGTLGGTSGEALALNESGGVVGWSETAAGSRHAFLWVNGTLQDLGALEGGTSLASAMNEPGQVAGTSQAADGSHAVLWSDGVLRDLGPGDGTPLLNVRGEVVWTAGGRALLWDGTQVVDLGSLGGSSTTPSAINNRGQVVGQSATASGQAHAFLWQDGAIQDLGTLGGPWSQAAGINESGAVSGSAQRGPDAFGHTWFHAFVWADGQMTDLGVAGRFDPVSFGETINNLGSVAGRSIDPSGDVWHPFLWSCGAMRGLFPFGSSERFRVTGLNNQDLVIGDDAHGHALVWVNSSARPFQTLGGPSNFAGAINNRGDVAGWAQDPAGRHHPVLWRRTGTLPTTTCGG